MEVFTVSAEEAGQLPETAAVFVARMIAPGEPYVGRTKRLRSRVARLLEPSNSDTKRLSLAGAVATIEYTPVYSDFEARWVHYQVLKREFSATYRRKLRMRGAPVIRIAWKNAFPRAVVTRRVGSGAKTSYFGPFRSRKDAEGALHAALDLFGVRRCIEDLVTSPEHPGCVYGEMKMCLAPCQQRSSPEEYAAEVRKLEQFLATLGEVQMESLSADRERATAELDFEKAAALHARWQKVKSAAAVFPEWVREIDRWNGVLLQAGCGEGHVRLFPIQGGAIGVPIEVALAEARAAGLKHLGSAVRGALEGASDVSPRNSAERAEHVAILQKWLYRNPKTRRGELVLADHDGVISSRRLAHAAERMLAPAKPEHTASATDPNS